MAKQSKQPNNRRVCALAFAVLAVILVAASILSVEMVVGGAAMFLVSLTLLGAWLLVKAVIVTVLARFGIDWNDKTEEITFG